MIADHLAPLYSSMLPAQKSPKISCADVKKQLVFFNEAMNPSLPSNLVNYITKNTFSTINDGSNDSAIYEMNPVYVSVSLILNVVNN